MATALYVADRALRLILVQASDAQLEADEYQDFYNAMNDFMADLEARGVDLGYTKVSGPDDTITIPDGAIRGLISNMAIEVAPDYEATVSPALAAQALRGMQAIRRLAHKRTQTRFPVTLPRGAGNSQEFGFDDSFYSAQSTALITLTNNTSVTEITTANVPVLVSGFWQTAEASGLSTDISGRILNRNTKAVNLHIVAQLEVTGGVAVTAHLYENGNQSLASQAGVADGTLITLRYTTTLLPNEFVELWIENDDDTTNLVVRDCQFQVS